jgi:hypothetical protein
MFQGRRELHLAAVFALLRGALGLPVDGDDLECLERADPGKLIKISSAHAVVNLLAGAKNDQRVARRLDPDLVAFLDLMQDRNAARNVALRAQLNEIANALQSIGIRAVALKGAAELIAPSYPRVADRLLGDLDILVPAYSLKEAVITLKARGYSTRGAADNPECHHAPRLFHEDHPAGVELHFALSPGLGGEILSPDEVLRNAIGAGDSASSLNVPNAVDRLCHVVVHGQINHGGYRSNFLLLREVADLHVLARTASEETWAHVYTRFANADATPILNAYLAASSRILHTPSPVPLTPQAEAWADRTIDLLQRPEVRRWRYVAGSARHYLVRFASNADLRRKYLHDLKDPETVKDFLIRHVAMVRSHQ